MDVERTACLGRDSALGEGYGLLEEGDWEAARTYFSNVVERNPTPLAFEGLGMATEMLNDEQATTTARGKAYELFIRDGDRRAAARVAMWLAIDAVTFRGEFAVANGWLQRSQSLLAGLQPASEHGWLAVTEAQKALFSE